LASDSQEEESSLKGTGSYYMKSPIDDLQALAVNTIMKAKEGQAAQSVSQPEKEAIVNKSKIPESNAQAMDTE
jgi:hypothetical protein